MDIEIAYNLALDYLYSYIDYSLKKSSEVAKADFNLDRVRALMNLLGNPEDKYPIFHVAGTKGKGSTSALMASALTAAGYRTGLYISPHLQDYVERIQIDGRPISHEQLIDLVEQVKPHVAAVPKLTTFEITTAIGLLHFAQQKAEAAVIEVGLGGRLDATNIVTPQVSVITSLSYDHMAVLGNTLTLIAGEKAGIIKPGIPVISSPQKEEALVVLERVANEWHAPLTLVGRDVSFAAGEHNLDGQTLSVHRLQKAKDGKMEAENNPESVILRIPLLGAHQVANAATAYTALKASRLSVSDAAIRNGFTNVYWPCRFEVVRRDPPVVIDSAHNADSAGRLRQALDDYFPGWPVIWIFAILEDKDVAGMIKELAPRLTKVIATQVNHPRALEFEKIAILIQQAGIPVEAVKSPSAALIRALELANDHDVVLSAGSVAFAGEMKTVWEKR